MMLQIKPEYDYLHKKVSHLRFSFICADFTAGAGWAILCAGTDGELYSFKKEHMRIITPLEVVLE